METEWTLPPPNLVQISRLMMPHMHQEGMKTFKIHIMRLSGESRQPPKQVWNGLREQGKDTGWHLWWLVGRAVPGHSQDLCDLNFQKPKEGACRI